ncbi:hypothetical protein HPB50_013352 [Hyalomma asiaticum]|uniref:Uncharacterized protein n=1 Tax=Hyalomma asiaticum TaxID=266040 RepID=A0ACB7T1V4_HYAAI|nr:hypothetical protein HPB50_013352 [Hyalomma asiaticum]
MDASEERRYQFVDHLMLVPSVSQLYFAVAERYHALKNDSLLAALALNAVEKCASQAYAHLGKPLVGKFSGPLGVVDDLAFKALEKLEDTCPLVSQTPLEVFDDVCDFAKLKCSNGQAYVLEQIDACRDLAERAVSAVFCPVETTATLARSARDIFGDVLTVTEYACDETSLDRVHSVAGKAFLYLTIWGQLLELNANYMTLLFTGDLTMLSEVLCHALSLPLPEDDDLSSSSSDEETVVHVCDTAAGRSEDGSDVSSSSPD